MANEERRGGGRTLRRVAIWVVVVVLTVAGGFGTGYFLRYKEMQGLRQRLAERKAEMAGQMASLEKQVLEAQKTQLEKALERAKLTAGLGEVLESLTVAAAEVAQKNFGRALQQIDAAKDALDGANRISPSLREVVDAKLDEIRSGLEQLDTGVGEQIVTLAQNLEGGKIPSDTAKPEAAFP